MRGGSRALFQCLIRTSDIVVAGGVQIVERDSRSEGLDREPVTARRLISKPENIQVRRVPWCARLNALADDLGLCKSTLPIGKGCCATNSPISVSAAFAVLFAFVKAARRSFRFMTCPQSLARICGTAARAVPSNKIHCLSLTGARRSRGCSGFGDLIWMGCSKNDVG